MTQTLNLDDVQSFEVNDMPIILRSTESYGDIIAWTITARGGVMLSEKPGVLEMIAKTMGSGTYSFSKEEIDHIFTESGAVFSISADVDSFVISLKCLKRFLPKLLPVISEMIRMPLFDAKEVELSRQQLTSDLKGEQDHPDSLLGLITSKAFLRNHPYINRPGGYLDTIASVTRDDLTSTLFRVFNRNNLVYSIVGNLSKDEASQYIQKYFPSLPSGKKAPMVPQVIENKPGETVFAKLDSPTTYFLAKFKAPSLQHKDFPALVLGTQILDNRLFEEVRTKRALTYAVSSSISMRHANSGTLYVSSTKLPEAVEVMMNEVQKIKTEAVDKRTVELQVKKYLSSWYLARELSSSQARIFTVYELSGLGWEASNSFIERLEKVTPADIQRVMNEYYKEYTVGIVGPEQIDLSKYFSAKKEKAQK